MLWHAKEGAPVQLPVFCGLGAGHLLGGVDKLYNVLTLGTQAYSCMFTSPGCPSLVRPCLGPLSGPPAVGFTQLLCVASWWRSAPAADQQHRCRSPLRDVPCLNPLTCDLHARSSLRCTRSSCCRALQGKASCRRPHCVWVGLHVTEMGDGGEMISKGRLTRKMRMLWASLDTASRPAGRPAPAPWTCCRNALHCVDKVLRPSTNV
jgi:hypothetical protein